jgi:cysteinyl-tRNA synthetase
MLKSNIPSTDKLDLFFEFDQGFGLRLNEVVEETKSDEIKKDEKKIDQLKQEGKYAESDEIRDNYTAKGYEVRNTTSGTAILKK